ncbi:hypothetical protein HKX48_006753 [Thoreauomyces humboldtii]|nr:hypothetical protein HKX48_006753 [Thoreauomyces humboldtii]
MRPGLPLHVTAVLAFLALAPFQASAATDRSSVLPRVGYQYVLLDPTPGNVTGEELVNRLEQVHGTFTDAKEQTGDIVAFANMPLASDKGEDGVVGVLVDYGDGCVLPALPFLPTTATHIALLNATTAATCNISVALTNTLTRLSTTNGTALIVFGDATSSPLDLASKATYPANLQIPTYLFQPSLGLFLMALINSSNVPGAQPFYLADNKTVTLQPNAPLPSNLPTDLFSDVGPNVPVVHEAADGLTHIGVRIDITDVPFTSFPPIWRFAVVSLGIFFSFSVPALLFLRWRATRYSSQPVSMLPAPNPTLDLAALMERYPTQKFGQVALTYTGDPSCTICLEDFERDTIVRCMPCGHAFHTDCVDKWITEQSAVCPLCRRDLVEKTGDENDLPVLTGRTGDLEAARAATAVPPVPWWRRIMARSSPTAGTRRATGHTAGVPVQRHVSAPDAGRSPHARTWWKSLLTPRSTQRTTPADISVDIPLEERQ